MPDTRRIFLLTAVALVTAVTLVATFAPRQQAPSDAPMMGQPGLRVYRAATGTFALPPAGRAPADFARAEADARAAGAPLAFTMWVDQTEFEINAWRDVLQVGRFPLSRPPVLDLAREVGVLVWPVAGVAPERVMRANGLAAERLILQHLALELRVRPDTGGPTPATPAATGAVIPYGLFTIPRNQWPLPAPPPTVPPLVVTLAP